MMALRVLPSVKVSDSRGILFTKGPTIQPSPAGMSRVNEMARHSEPFPGNMRPIFWTDDYCDLLHVIRWKD